MRTTIATAIAAGCLSLLPGVASATPVDVVPGDASDADDAPAADLAPLATLDFAGDDAPATDPAARALQRELTAGLWNAYRGVSASVRGDAFAAATADGALAATASLRGEVAIPLCRLVAVQAAASASTLGDTAYDARAGGCLPLPVGRPFVQVGRQRQVQRSPLELPRSEGARLDGWTVDLDVGGYRLLWSRYEFDFGNVRLGYVETHDATHAETSHVLDGEGVQWRRLGKGLDGEAQAWTLARVRFAGFDAAPGDAPAEPNASTMLIHILAVDGLRLTRHLALSAGVGFEHANIVMATAPASSGPVPYLARDQRVGYDVALTGAVDAGGLRVRPTLRARSLAEPWQGAQVVHGHELSATTHAAWRDDLVADLTLVGAQVTRFGADGRDSAPVTTAGASASVVSRLRGPLHAFARVDLAHQLTLDGAPATSLAATVGVSAAIERRR